MTTDRSATRPSARTLAYLAVLSGCLGVLAILLVAVGVSAGVAVGSGALVCLMSGFIVLNRRGELGWVHRSLPEEGTAEPLSDPGRGLTETHQTEPGGQRDAARASERSVRPPALSPGAADPRIMAAVQEIVSRPGFSFESAQKGHAYGRLTHESEDGTESWAWVWRSPANPDATVKQLRRWAFRTEHNSAVLSAPEEQTLRAAADQYRWGPAVTDLLRRQVAPGHGVTRRVFQSIHDWLGLKNELDDLGLDTESEVQTLTPREQSILDLLSSGSGVPDIAATLKISAQIVGRLRRQVYSKLEMAGVAEAERPTSEPLFASNPDPLRDPPGRQIIGRALDLTELPLKSISGEFVRISSEHLAPLELLSQAPALGRFHRQGEPPVLYAASELSAAWAEILSHMPLREAAGQHMSRCVSRLEARDLIVLDLADSATRTALGISLSDLFFRGFSQDLASFASERGAEGLLVPSQLSASSTDLVVFQNGLTKLRITNTAVTQLQLADAAPDPGLRDRLKQDEQLIEDFVSALEDGRFEDWVESLSLPNDEIVGLRSLANAVGQFTN
jgi:DNA-binding CsgD family transcriptional regulator/RES domain-containing protein